MNEDTVLFNNMNIKQEIKDAISEMGFEEATPIQKEAIPYVLEGRDVIGIAQTGTGKTCAFGVPIINNVDSGVDALQALVLCPTRELAIQTGEELQSLSKYLEEVRVLAIYGGGQMDRQIASLKKKPQIIVGTPGRILDHMRRKTIKLDNLKTIVLDEADEMLDIGFREELDVILEKTKGNRQTVLFSATMSKDVLAITKKYLKKDQINIEIEHKTLTAPKIKQYLVEVKQSQKLDALSRIIDSEIINLGVIFCNTKRMVDELCDHLKIRGCQVASIHGDMKQSQRDLVMKKFRSGKLNFLIATDVAARGIDVDNVEVIINYDIPSDEEYYVHRIGRTGRAGKEGKSITIINPKEMYKVRQIEKYANVKMETYELASAEVLNNKKINDLMKSILENIQKEDLETETSIVETFLKDTDVSPVSVIASLIKMQTSKDKFEEIDFRGEAFEERRKEGTKLFVTLGKKDGLKRTDLKDLIAETCNISKSKILDAEILNTYSFLTVSEDIANKVVEIIDNSEYEGRRVSIEISTGTKTSKRQKRAGSSKSRRESKNNRR